MATPSAHTEVPGGVKVGFPPFRKDTYASQLIWLVVMFVLLYWLMSRIALPRIAGIFEARGNRIAGDLAEAERLKRESEAANTAYEKALADARSRAQGLANSVREQLAAEAEANRKALEQQLNVKLADAERAIAATKATATAGVRQIATEAATAIVDRILGAGPEPGRVARTVDEVLKR